MGDANCRAKRAAHSSDSGSKPSTAPAPGGTGGSDAFFAVAHVVATWSGGADREQETARGVRRSASTMLMVRADEGQRTKDGMVAIDPGPRDLKRGSLEGRMKYGIAC